MRILFAILLSCSAFAQSNCADLSANAQIVKLIHNSINNFAPELDAPNLIGIQVKAPKTKIETVKPGDKIISQSLNGANIETIFLGCQENKNVKNLFFEAISNIGIKYLIVIKAEHDLNFWQRTSDKSDVLGISSSLFWISSIHRVEDKCSYKIGEKFTFSKECLIKFDNVANKKMLPFQADLAKNLQITGKPIDPKLIEYMLYNKSNFGPEIALVNILQASNRLTYTHYEKEFNIENKNNISTFNINRFEKCEPREDTFDPLDFYRYQLGNFAYQVLGSTPEGELIIYTTENSGGNGLAGNIVILKPKEISFNSVFGTINDFILTTKAIIYLGDRCGTVTYANSFIEIAEGSECKAQRIILAPDKIEIKEIINN